MIDLALTFAALRDWRNRRAAEVDADALPAELAASIAAARITVRPPRDLAEAHRFTIDLPGVGVFHWTDDDDAAARIRRGWPRLNPAQVARALRLLAGVMANAAADHDTRALARAAASTRRRSSPYDDRSYRWGAMQ